MKKLLVAALMVMLASPAFAAIQNVKVSGDITESYLNDNSLDLGYQIAGVPQGLSKQSVFLSQVRLRVDADLSDNVSTTVGLINERAWNAENNSDIGTNYTNYSNDTNVQLYLASITLREFLYSPLTLTVGRQVFNYGNGLILGDGGPINAAGGNLANIYQELTMRTAYDGVKAILDYKPLTIDLIYFKNDQTLGSIDGVACGTAGITGGVNCSHQNSDVYGYNANYQLSDPWNTVVEQYLFARINGNGLSDITDGLPGGVGYLVDKGSKLYVPGLRASTNPIKGLNVQAEVAWQLGTQVVGTSTGAQEAEHRDAMAAQLMASYALPVLQKYKPTVNASYTYVSGDKNGLQNYSTDAVKSAKTYSAWDEFNTIQGAGTIYRALFPMSNESILSAGASVNPLEDVTIGATWSGIWANDRISAQNPLVLLQPDGTTVATSGTTKNNDYGIGNEADVNLTYNYTEDVTFGLSMGWFVPGSVFDKANRDTASQAIADIGVKF
jgi:hypothetical protein